MKRIFKILGIAMILSTILVLVLSGTALAAGSSTDNGTQIRNQGDECLCGECPCQECPCDECVCSCNNYNAGPGTYGAQNCNGNMRGEGAPYGDCDCDGSNCNLWCGSGQHRQQKGK